MKITLLGAPGAGKGTQAEVISVKLAVPTISTGNMLRAAVAAKTALGLQVESLLQAGDLVPDDIILGILRERVAQQDCQNGYILDGVPRTEGQAAEMETGEIDVDICLFFDIADSEIIARLSGRRSCPGCSASYHILHNPPATENVCDKCGEALVIRDDDKPETIKRRLTVYREQTASLVQFYQTRGKLKTIDGSGTVEQTTKLAFHALGVS